MKKRRGKERTKPPAAPLEWKIEPAEIEMITHIPAEDWGRMARKTIVGPGTQIITLKGPIERTAGLDFDLRILEKDLGALTAGEKVQLYKQLAYLLEYDLVDFKDKRVEDYLSRIYAKLSKMIRKV